MNRCFETKAVFLGVLFAVVLAFFGCRGSGEFGEGSKPPKDVPHYLLGEEVGRKVGPGGYQVSFKTHSDMAVTESFFADRSKPLGWIPVGKAKGGEDSRLMYFRKGQRLLMVFIVPENDGLGCRYTVSETRGERVRGNVRHEPKPEKKKVKGKG